MKKNFFPVSFFFVFLGFLDTAFLTIEHYRNTLPPCTLDGCDLVLTSQYATFGPISLALVGLFYYVGLFILLMLYFQSQKQVFRTLFLIGILSGLAVSIVLFSLQAFVIHAFCQYCLASEVVIVVLCGTYLFSRKSI